MAGPPGGDESPLWREPRLLRQGLTQGGPAAQCVAINPDDAQAASEVFAKENAFELEPTPVSVELSEVVT